MRSLPLTHCRQLSAASQEDRLSHAPPNTSTVPLPHPIHRGSVICLGHGAHSFLLSFPSWLSLRLRHSRQRAPTHAAVLRFLLASVRLAISLTTTGTFPVRTTMQSCLWSILRSPKVSIAEKLSMRVRQQASSGRTPSPLDRLGTSMMWTLRWLCSTWLNNCGFTVVELLPRANEGERVGSPRWVDTWAFVMQHLRRGERQRIS